MDNEPTVFVVAGDAKARRLLVVRMKSIDSPHAICRSAEEFFEISAAASRGCVVLSVSRPDVDFDLLRHLGGRGPHLPVIALSGLGDVATAVQAMKLGAFDYLEEPCSDRRLARAIDEAIRWDADNRRSIAATERSRRRVARLAPGHRAVLDRIVVGQSNREIAVELKLSVRAIEVRRAKIMDTMRARSLADLIRQTIIIEGVITRETDPDPDDDQGADTW